MSASISNRLPPPVAVLAMAMAVVLVEVVQLAQPGGVGSAGLWVPVLVGVVVIHRHGAALLPWLLGSALLARLPILLWLSPLPPLFSLLDTAVEGLVVAVLGQVLRQRLPRGSWSAPHFCRIVLPRLLPLAVLAGLAQALGRHLLSPIEASLLPGLVVGFALAQLLAGFAAGVLLASRPVEALAAARRRSLLLLGSVLACAVLAQFGLPSALWLGFVLLAWLALGMDIAGVTLGGALLLLLPALAELTAPGAPGLAVLPSDPAGLSLAALALGLCWLLALESAQREAGRSQLATLVHARTEVLQAELRRRRELEERLGQVPDYDRLTGSPNRALLLDRLNLALADARRQQTGLAVCCLALDGLQVINDAAGRGVGDAVLVEVARRMRVRLRGSDTVARVGGAEFVVLALRAPSPAAAAEVAMRVLACFDPPLHPQAAQLGLGASLGIALFPQHGEAAETLLSAADAAAQEIRRGGSSGWMLHAGRAVGADDASEIGVDEEATPAEDVTSTRSPTAE